MLPNQTPRFERRTDAPGKNLTRQLEPTIQQTLQYCLLAQAQAGFIDTDWLTWMTPAVTAHMSARGRWMDVATLVRHEVGNPCDVILQSWTVGEIAQEVRRISASAYISTMGDGIGGCTVGS